MKKTKLVLTLLTVVCAVASAMVDSKRNAESIKEEVAKYLADKVTKEG